MDQTGGFAASSWLVRQVARFELFAPSVGKSKCAQTTTAKQPYNWAVGGSLSTTFSTSETVVFITGLARIK
jgi:hypothetical protein